MTILIHHPFQHLSASVVIKVGIDIRQRDTVRVQETLKQQVVFQRVYFRDTQTVSHHTTSSRTTSWPHHYTEFIAS